MSSHPPERRELRSPDRPLAGEAHPPSTDEPEETPAEGRGALFDGTFRERLKSRRATWSAAGDDVPPIEDDETLDTPWETSSEPAPDPGGGLPPEREGLPPGFRMRHDRHYVDELAAPTTGGPLRYLDLRRLRSREPLPSSEGLGALVASIRELGLVQPLVVRPQGDAFEVVAGATRLAAASAAGLHTVPCVVQEVDDRRAQRLAEAARLRGRATPPTALETAEEEATAASLPPSAILEIERSLRSIVSSVEMMRSAPGALLERAARDLMAAEAHRCDWFVRASRSLQEELEPRLGVVSLPSLIERQLSQLEPEHRLLGIETELDSQSVDRERSQSVDRERLLVRADEALLNVACEGILRSLLAPLQDTRGGRLRILLGASSGQATIEVRQDLVELTVEQRSRLFDPEAPEPPGGYASAVGLACARRIFEVHGGDVDLAEDSSSGSWLGPGFGVLGKLPLLA